MLILHSEYIFQSGVGRRRLSFPYSKKIIMITWSKHCERSSKK